MMENIDMAPATQDGPHPGETISVHYSLGWFACIVSVKMACKICFFSQAAMSKV